METFLLPKGCVKRVESLCCRYLWAGSIEGHAFAQVSWTNVCLPKREGGLSLRIIHTILTQKSFHPISFARRYILAGRFIHRTIGNGNNAYFWFDSWIPLGPLISLLGFHGPRDLRIPLQAKVTAASNDTTCTLPDLRSNESAPLHAYLMHVR